MEHKFNIGDRAYLVVNDHIHKCTIENQPTQSMSEYEVRFKDENPYIGWVTENYPESKLHYTEQEANMAIVEQLMLNIQEDIKLARERLQSIRLSSLDRGS